MSKSNNEIRKHLDRIIAETPAGKEIVINCICTEINKNRRRSYTERNLAALFRERTDVRKVYGGVWQKVGGTG